MAEEQTPPPEGDVDDDLHKNFREALERKKAAQHTPGSEATGAKGVGPSNNTKRQRQFRRKSGG